MLIAAAIVAALLAWPLPNQYRARWIAALTDLAHYPLFALATWSFWIALGHRLLPACVASACLAASGEIGQRLIGRSASMHDFLSGVAGTVLAAALVVGLQQPREPLRLALGAGLAAAIACSAAWIHGPVLIDAWIAYRAFPVLSDFGSPWEPRRWYTAAADLRRERVPGGPWFGSVAPSAAAAPSAAGESPPGVILFPVVGNWERYRHLRWEFTTRDESTSVMISVRDGRQVRPPQRRFELRRTLPAGRHSMVVDLRELAAGSQAAAVAVDRVQSIHLVVEHPPHPLPIRLHRLALE